MASSNWQEYRLADLCESIDYGYTTSAVDAPVGPKFLRITDIVGTCIDWRTVPYCNIPAELVEQFRLHDGDVVIARTGATTGFSAYIAAPPDAVFASYLVRLKVGDKAVSRFIAYFLKTSVFWDYMRGVLGDKSAQPNASATTMTQAKLRLPSLTEQRAIVHILGTLDDKIELNRRMNETLEAMARAIFKSWFVDFDPVRAKSNGRNTGLPKEIADLFPDSFQGSELGRIPSGWKVRSLDEIANYLNGLALQKYPPESEDYLPVIKIAQLHAGNALGADQASVNIPPEYIVENGDVLFSWSGSLEVVIWCGGRGALNQHLFKVTSNRFEKWFYYLWTKHHLSDFAAIAAGKATTMGHIQRHHLSEAKVLIPPSELLEQMDRNFAPLISRFINNRVESCTLAAIRDSLLPKLLSGEIRVRDAEKFLEPNL